MTCDTMISRYSDSAQIDILRKSYFDNLEICLKEEEEEHKMALKS